MTGYGIPIDYDAGEFAERVIKQLKDEITKFRAKHLGVMEMRLDGTQVNVLCIVREDWRGNITAFQPIAALLTPDEIKRLRNFDGSDKNFHIEERK